MDNPIGYGGRIAKSFAKLIYEYCNNTDKGYYSGVRPWNLHNNLTGSLRQFADYRQHDAQEFLTNFLDAIHEDLNRIKKKEYIEIPDFDKYESSEDRKREFLDLRWNGIYLRRNKSICTDLFAGLMRSTVTCPRCQFTAITFDPFMHLLVPLKASKSMQKALFPSHSRNGGYGYNGYNGHHNGHHNGYRNGHSYHQNHRSPLGTLHKNGSSVSSMDSNCSLNGHPNGQHNGHHNGIRNGHRRRFEASDESGLSGNEEDMSYELILHLLPENIQSTATKITLSVGKSIIDDNDWIRLHALIYDQLLKRMKDEELYKEDERDKVDEDTMRRYRKEMIESPHYPENDHYLYYGQDLVHSVKDHNQEPIVPKQMLKDLTATIPMFQVLELAQSDKVLYLKSIAKDQFNIRIEDYTARHGVKRMVVQQLPLWYCDPDRKDLDGDDKVNCYTVFRKPSQEHPHSNSDSNSGDKDGEKKSDSENVKGAVNGEISGDIDNEADDMAKSVAADLEQICDLLQMDEESPYEPFSVPRIFYEKGLTAKLDDCKLNEYLYKTAKGLITSIAGDEATDSPYDQQMEIRYSRNQGQFNLDAIDEWTKVVVDSEHSNSSSDIRQPIKMMVIVFTLEMHQIYTQFQREKEEKEAQCEERRAKYLENKKREKATREAMARKFERNRKRPIHGRDRGRKRSFDVMNGGNSAYGQRGGGGGNGRGGGYDGNGHKRQRVGVDENDNVGYRQCNGHQDDRNGHCESGNSGNSGNEENKDEIRDPSLPSEFQPIDMMAKDIKQCFGMFLSREQLGRDNKWFCKKCKDHVQGWKKLDLWWLPTHLIIVIKRFDNHGQRKYSNKIHYPVEGLDLSEIIRGGDSLDIYRNQKSHDDDADATTEQNGKQKKQKKEQFLYDLYAVINHSGSMSFGHYTANVKYGNQWYDISDSSVQRSYQDPISATAYILCYKKRQTTTTTTRK